MIPRIAIPVIAAALTQLLVLPSLAWADGLAIPPPPPVGGAIAALFAGGMLGNTTAVLFTGTIAGLLAAFGLLGLRRMARDSEGIEEEGAPAESGDESA